MVQVPKAGGGAIAEAWRARCTHSRLGMRRPSNSPVGNLLLQTHAAHRSMSPGKAAPTSELRTAVASLARLLQDRGGRDRGRPHCTSLRRTLSSSRLYARSPLATVGHTHAGSRPLAPRHKIPFGSRLAMRSARRPRRKWPRADPHWCMVSLSAIGPSPRPTAQCIRQDVRRPTVASCHICGREHAGLHVRAEVCACKETGGPAHPPGRSRPAIGPRPCPHAPCKSNGKVDDKRCKSSRLRSGASLGVCLAIAGPGCYLGHRQPGRSARPTGEPHVARRKRVVSSNVAIG